MLARGQLIPRLGAGPSSNLPTRWGFLNGLIQFPPLQGEGEGGDGGPAFSALAHRSPDARDAGGGLHTHLPTHDFHTQPSRRITIVIAVTPIVNSIPFMKPIHAFWFRPDQSGMRPESASMGVTSKLPAT
jgi:hypothetical protein